LTKYLSAVLVLKLFALFAISSFPNRSNDKVYTNISPLLIGDSVMVDIGEEFKSQVPKATIDGKVTGHHFD
jgi:hypothetical protein